MRKLFAVSTKAALFNTDRSKVLAIHIDSLGDWGLPGGHIENDETPDEALKRELLEECGVTSDDLKRVDFFVHSDDKIVLAYTGTVNDQALESQQGELEGKPQWLTKDEFQTISIEPNYRRLVLDRW